MEQQVALGHTPANLIKANRTTMENHMAKAIALLLVAIQLTGCVVNKDYTWGEKGYIWCNNRFLEPKTKHFDKKEETAATKGYMYALASAYALQRSDLTGEAHKFRLPERLIHLEGIREENRDKSGFEYEAFLLKPINPEDKEEIVIAFTGSNDGADWLKTNIGRDIAQYQLATKTTENIIKKYQTTNQRVVLTGTSLGGGLAVHVTKSPITRNMVDEAWAFNPSPKTYASNKVDKRIWLVASKGEGLALIRKPFFSFISGWGKIGSPEPQTVESLELIKSNFGYAHYRWGIARQLLFVADYVQSDRYVNPESTEPLEIIKASEFKSCRPPYDVPPTYDLES